MSQQTTLTERSRTKVDAAVASRLTAEPAFWKLVRSGIVTPRSTGPDELELETGGWVGGAKVGDTVVQVVPKAPGIVQALLEWVSSTKDVSFVEAPESGTGLDTWLVRALTREGQRYLDRRLPVYREHPALATVPHGPLDVARTLVVRATRGPLSTVYRDFRVSPEGLVDLVLEAACVEVERHRGKLSREALADVRRVLTALSSGDQPKLSVPEAVGEARDLQAAPATKDDNRRLAVLCELVLTARAAGLRDSAWSASAGFVDLARVFEVAVRGLLRQNLGGSLVHNGRHLTIPLFSPGIPGTVDPDLVLGPLARPFAIGDVKYEGGCRRPF